MKDIATKSTTQYILDKYDLYPKKKYGQNFLIDPHVVEKIVRCSSVNEKCAVIEVGPGIGALTQVLARYAGYVRSYEIDTRFKGVYEEFLNQENIEIVIEDYLKVNIEDLISIGTIGLIKAINTFKPEKKIKLATYASRCIENEILMYLRRNNKTRTEVSIDEPLNVDWEGNELLLSDILGTDADVIYKDIEDEVDKTLLKKALTKLSDREQKIINLRFGINGGGNEKTQKEVADMLGISQSYISSLEKKIKSRLKKERNKYT